MSNPNIQKAIEQIDIQLDEAEDDAEEINLDQIHFGKFTTELKTKLENIKNLASLSLNDCKLSSLDNFPSLPNLIRLELIDNNLDGKSLHNLSKLEELQSLSLGGNEIKSYNDIQSLGKLKKLFQLDLINCQICNIADYREKLFSMFPTLGILDNKDKEGNEIEYDEDSDDDLEDEDEENGNKYEDEDDDGEEGSEVESDDEEEDEEEEEESDEEEDKGPAKKQKK